MKAMSMVRKNEEVCCFMVYGCVVVFRVVGTTAGENDDCARGRDHRADMRTIQWKQVGLVLEREKSAKLATTSEAIVILSDYFTPNYGMWGIIQYEIRLRDLLGAKNLDTI